MSSKRKTSAPTKVLVDTDTCQSNAAVHHDAASQSSIAPADHDYDSDQSHDRSLKVVTSPSSLSADDDDVRASTSCSVSESSCLVDGLALNLSTPSPGIKHDCASASSQRHWLSAEVTCVLKKIELVIAAAETLDEKRRRVDEMLTELESIRRHLLMAHSDSATTASLSVSVT